MTPPVRSWFDGVRDPELVGLSGVRVASPDQKDGVMQLPSLRQGDRRLGAGWDGCGAPVPADRLSNATGGQGGKGDI